MAMMARLKGSPVGVMMAPPATTATMAIRRLRRRVWLETIPATCRNTSTTGTSKAMPNARAILTKKPRYSWGAKKASKRSPPKFNRAPRARGIAK
jgi:hypothetical protein